MALWLQQADGGNEQDVHRFHTLLVNLNGHLADCFYKENTRRERPQNDSPRCMPTVIKQ